MAIQKEIWENHIEGNLFKGNEFLLASVDASEYVMQGKVVHIPQAGAKGNVVKNRSSLPATVVQRTDTDITYSLDVFTTDPILIPNADTIELSYDKRESILVEYEESLREVTGDNILIDWAPAASILRTSGIPNNDPTASLVSANAYLPSATGTRLKFGLYDVAQAALTLDNKSVAMNDRYALLDPRMYQQLIDDLTATKYREFSMVFDPKTNVIMELFGFKIMKRPTVLAYDNSGTPVVKAYGASGAAADNAAALFWQKNAVERALGEILAFEHMGDPTYYGDIYSFLVRMGARKRRTNEENILAIVQQAGS